MTRIYPEQLASSLQESLRGRYLIWGNEPLLLQESQDAIRKAAQEQGFEEHFRFLLNKIPIGMKFLASAKLSAYSQAAKL